MLRASLKPLGAAEALLADGRPRPDRAGRGDRRRRPSARWRLGRLRLAAPQRVDEVGEADLAARGAAARRSGSRAPAATLSSSSSVDDDVVVFRPVAHLVGRLGHALPRRSRRCPGRGARSRCSSAPMVGGSTKIVTRSSRRLLPSCCVPCQSMSMMMSRRARAPPRPKPAACRSGCRRPSACSSSSSAVDHLRRSAPASMKK